MFLRLFLQYQLLFLCWTELYPVVTGQRFHCCMPCWLSLHTQLSMHEVRIHTQYIFCFLLNYLVLFLGWYFAHKLLISIDVHVAVLYNSVNFSNCKNKLEQLTCLEFQLVCVTTILLSLPNANCNLNLVIRINASL